MDGCIRLYAQTRESREKRAMGFESSAWDEKLIRYGEQFEDQVMDLAVNIPLEEALDRCWTILADCFEPEEIGIRRNLIEAHWPKELGEKAKQPEEAIA
ncbi:hypothetical protein LCGC14_2586510 [marine sediment metagenome]|uniref:ATPase F1/V1/A1 complex alpha/beta subunit nucleotide-binding domain-containing protein n=1 Tax=marine sediment metagenome TaxID=412755 RepID=A0A0F9ADB1_9ZZZZ